MADKNDQTNIIKSLEEIRDKLTRVNMLNGNLSRYYAIKKEINENGWDIICQKYHPDFNMSDPAAYELFNLYVFVYQTMNQNHF